MHSNFKKIIIWISIWPATINYTYKHKWLNRKLSSNLYRYFGKILVPGLNETSKHETPVGNCLQLLFTTIISTCYILLKILEINIVIEEFTRKPKDFVN